MKSKWVLQVKYFLGWILYFIGAKTIFLIYHANRLQDFKTTEVFNIFLYGFRLDASFTAYLCVLPFFCYLVQSLFPKLPIYKAVHYYTWVLLFIISLLTVADLELYQAWGFRLDATPLQYLVTPAEMAASTASSPLLLLFILFMGLTLVSVYLYYRFFYGFIVIHKRDFIYSFVSFWLLLLLIIPMRGGIQQIPINHSDVYFSDKIFLNQAAINVPWNVMYSLSTQAYKNTNPYNYYSSETASKMVGELYPVLPPAGGQKIINQARPNILFIILESYTAKLVGCLDGEPGVTPNLDQIAQKGILFNNIYASGDRSEKGIVAILSGYPVQPRKSIIKMPQKTQNLPHLNRELTTAGYHSSFYYGGELAFGNIKSYLKNAGYHSLISKDDFDAKDYNSKWGVHDHVLLQRVLKDLKNEKQPFFTTVFTLSSHEPYEIPIPKKFPEKEEADQFKNSVYYTDYALGKFFAQAQQEPWWATTLVVLVADHGHRFPGNDLLDAPSKYKIPFILTGGALAAQPQIISKVGSQTDIIPTVLAQLDLPYSQFSWGKNLLNPATQDFAFYIFQDGFGFVTPQGAATFDNISKKVIRQDTGVTPAQINYGKAYMQASFQDFLQK